MTIPARDSSVSKGRLDAVDLLRGVVMVLMALDHVRDYASNQLGVDPTDLEKTNATLFLTRWLTHFCAPVFIFLAGTGAFLSKAGGKNTRALSWFLLTRGLWLLVLEITVLRWGWVFNFDYRFPVDGQVVWALTGDVIWVIGASMMIMAGLVFLPTAAVAVLGIALIAYHNLFDTVTLEQCGRWADLWKIAHQGGSAEIFPGVRFGTGYTLLPWLGVMAAGYGFGPMLLLERSQRQAQLLGLGLALTAIFIGLRLSNRYGDPQPWSEQKDALFTFFSFINAQKYPPSLLFLLMTLGPAIVTLALVDRNHGALGRFFITFGRVPLFFYLLHIPLIHGAVVGLDYYRFGWSPQASASFWGLQPDQVPQGYGYAMWMVYLLWVGVILLLYPLCWWFARLKHRRRYGWLSYL
jgi:uncharacterized membrane protein